ncbi:hypothetical protein [Pectobacterium brasiliense]|uniref:hypothetical protein n=1 Tax=Pectobacterium brasiliense TaxID=180957 RepID=UPI002A82C353|nr:hypothetical protein [Pectobacterium brasiliense]MDY4347175.1 hypothetical protein [Pectobacterium brasiliense]
MTFNDEPKNQRASIHNKYKRRLRSLSRHIDDFLYHARLKLDESVAGNIYKREEIEVVVQKATELAQLLPNPNDTFNGLSVRDDFFEILERAAGETEKIMADADSFFKNLSQEEWEEMVSSYNQKKT